MRKLRPFDYMEIITALQPDAYVALADEFYSGALLYRRFSFSQLHFAGSAPAHR